MQISSNVKAIIQEVNNIVTPAFMVGGSVRDMILGKEPKDYDFTTPLLPDEIEAKAHNAGCHVYLIGKRFGTVGFKVSNGSGKFQHVEVTTFRREEYTQGSRKPQVEFISTLEEDLSRRDFCMNAIAIDSNGRPIDPFGGRLDIIAKKIRSVGDATDRFREDPLRMLRAARFAAQLGFDIDENMVGKIRKMPEKILTISRERWVQELDKLLIQENVKVGIEILMRTYLMRYMLPSLWLAFQTPSTLDDLSELMNRTEATTDNRWGAFLAYTGRSYTTSKESREGNILYPQQHLISQEIAHGIAYRLKFSKERFENINAFIENISD